MKHAANKPIGEDIEKLLKLTDSTIGELRGYVSTLKEEADEVDGSILIQAIKQQVVKFREFYGIAVKVEASDGFKINDRLAAEAVQIVSEGLSNIKRHTKAKTATIRFYEKAEKLFLEIENEKQDAVVKFVPKSIAGRAESLGGAARAEVSDTHTKILVEIPL